MREANVLVVEDDANLRDTLVWALQDDGIDVAAAVDGPDAVHKATVKAPGLVVLDIGLPGLDGFGVATALRARVGTDLPILVITADGRAREKAETVGAYAYLHKPFDVDVLVQRVREGFSGPQTNQLQ